MSNMRKEEATLTHPPDVTAARLLKLVRHLKLLAAGLFFSGLGFGVLFVCLQRSVETGASNLVACLVSLVAAILAQRAKVEASRALASLTNDTRLDARRN